MPISESLARSAISRETTVVGSFATDIFVCHDNSSIALQRIQYIHLHYTMHPMPRAQHNMTHNRKGAPMTRLTPPVPTICVFFSDSLL